MLQILVNHECKVLFEQNLARRGMKYKRKHAARIPTGKHLSESRDLDGITDFDKMETI